MPRHNLAEAMPAPDTNEPQDESDQLVKSFEEADARKEASEEQVRQDDVRDEAVALIQEGLTLPTLKEQEAKRVAELKEAHDAIARQTLANQHAEQGRSEERFQADWDQTMLAAKKPHVSVWSRVKGWFGKK